MQLDDQQTHVTKKIRKKGLKRQIKDAHKKMSDAAVKKICRLTDPREKEKKRGNRH